jgi:O-antigen/teichoic acid export membrane protein
MLKFLAQRAGFARIFGGSVLSQGLLSATNLLAGLILVRRAPQAQYGYYVLIMSAVPLLAQLQSSFINPILQSEVTIAAVDQRRNFVGGLLREQRLLMLVVAVASLLICAIAWACGALNTAAAVIFALGVLAAVAWLFREFFRMVLVSYRRPYDVLKGDVAFSFILIAGVWLSTLTAKPAVYSALTIVTAAGIGGWFLSRHLRRYDPWNIHGSPGALIQTVRVGAWAATGSGIHWLFSQGYTFIVAARLDVSAVAAIAATRLLLSPLGVFSLGIAAMMYSTSTLWLKHHGAHGLLRRVLLFALTMGVATIAYLIVMWIARDWIFLHIIKKDYPERDLLLGIWSLVFLCTVIRDQVIFLLIAHGRWKLLAGLTAFCAVLGLSVSSLAIPRFGAAGGLLGLLAGEIAHVVGVLLLTFRVMRSNAQAAFTPVDAIPPEPEQS